MINPLDRRFFLIPALLVVILAGGQILPENDKEAPGKQMGRKYDVSEGKLVFVENNSIKAVIPPVIPKFKVMATIFSYNSVLEQTDFDYCIAASGLNVCKYPDGVIACPSWLSFGTRVEIDDKVYTCQDRMAKRWRDRWVFDILKPTIEESRAWGRQIKEVVIY